jgi:Fic family protein
VSPRPDPLAPLAARLDVAEAVDSVRAACLELRRHPALRRSGAPAAAEAGVRAARASAALEGARLPVDLVRDAVRGAGLYPDDATGATVRGAVRALAEIDRLGSVWQRAPLQALARLHTAAMAGALPPDAVGRPREPGEQPEDSRDLVDDAGREIEAPEGEALQAQLKSLVRLLTKPADSPALLVAAVAHAEIAVIRPFRAGNGVVARALCRAVLIGRGVDTTGVAVWEAGLLAMGPRYRAGLAAYAADGEAALAGWVTTFAEAMRDGVTEGHAVCDALMTGRLGVG